MNKGAGPGLALQVAKPPYVLVRSLQTKKNMKPSLKIIHARLIAQARVNAGISAAGVMGAVYGTKSTQPRKLQIRELKLDDFEVQKPVAQRGVVPAEAATRA